MSKLGGPLTSSATVSNLVISNNIIEYVATSSSSNGVSLVTSYSITNATISGNLFRNCYIAVLMTNFGTGTIEGVTITGNWVIEDNMAVNGGMIGAYGASNVQITNNMLHGGIMQDQSGIYFSYSNNCTASGNTIIYSILGVHVDVGCNYIALLNNKYGSPNFYYSQWLSVDPTATNFSESGDTQLSAAIVGTTEGGTLSPGTSTIKPTVSFNTPNGTIISSPTQITVNASDSGSGVAGVYFFVDGIPQGFSGTAPYSFTFDPSQYAAGPHQLMALAIDNYANLSTYVSVSVQAGVSIRRAQAWRSAIPGRT